MSGSRGARHRPGGRSRSLAELTRAYGTPLPPTTPVTVPEESDDRGGVGRRSRRGPARQGYGWSPVPEALTAYTANTAQIGGLFPLVGSDALPPTGAAVGVDVDSRAGFYADLIGWILAAVITNPNVHVTGKPGRGKSALVKALCLRLLAYGYRVLIPGDVKDEYEPLCRALDVEPLALGHGLRARVNPLDRGPLGAAWEQLTPQARSERAPQMFAKWQILLEALAEAAGAQVSASDSAALTAVMGSLTRWDRGEGHLVETTIPAVWDALCNPTADVWAACRYAGRQDFLDATRQTTDALGKMVKGPLAGLFDAPTTIRIDWDAPIMSMSLRRLQATGDDLTVGAALTCMNSWSTTMVAHRPPGQHTVMLRDESWRQMRLGVKAVQALDSSLRLSRTEDTIQLLVGHKPGDTDAVGDTGSQAVNIARELVSMCDTKVMFGQDAAIAERMAAEFDLPDMVTDWITNWAMGGVGRAVWMVGSRLYRVSTVLTPLEKDLFHTNDQLVNHAADGHGPGGPAALGR